MKKIIYVLVLILLIINSLLISASRLDDFAYREAIDAQVVQDRIKTSNYKENANMWLKTPTNEERKTAIKNRGNNAKKPEVKALIQKMNNINDVKKYMIKKKTTVKKSKLTEEQMLLAAKAAQAAGERMAAKISKGFKNPEDAKTFLKSLPVLVTPESKTSTGEIIPAKITAAGRGMISSSVDPFAKTQSGRSRFSREQTMTDLSRFKQELRKQQKTADRK